MYYKLNASYSFRKLFGENCAYSICLLDENDFIEVYLNDLSSLKMIDGSF